MEGPAARVGRKQTIEAQVVIDGLLLFHDAQVVVHFIVMSWFIGTTRFIMSHRRTDSFGLSCPETGVTYRELATVSDTCVLTHVVAKALRNVGIQLVTNPFGSFQSRKTQKIICRLSS